MDTQLFELDIASITPPQGKKPGSLHCANGATITCWPGQIGNFQPGGKYRVSCYNKPFNGADQWTVSDPAKGGVIDRIGGPPETPFTPPADPNEPPPVGNASPPQEPPVDNHAEQIFVTGVVGRAMGSGKFGITDIKALTFAAKEAFHAEPEKPY